MSFHTPNAGRVRSGPLGTSDAHGNFGLFIFKTPKAHSSAVLRVIASEDGGWEHVSVSTSTRCPTWEEMCFIKEQFWDGDDCVVQFHPPESEYVNNHPFCLHLWRPIGLNITTPPAWMVGIKAAGVLV